jgi:methylthioribulose-1-phosphate dehydratase
MKHTIQKELVNLIRQMHDKGWSAATGTNYSYRIDDQTYMVTISGLDKSMISTNDFMKVYVSGGICEGYTHLKPSAENEIHAAIYAHTDAQVIVHTHSVFGTILAQHVTAIQGESLLIQGYEVQKAIHGISTHDHALYVPVFSNTQVMDELVESMAEKWLEIKAANGFLIGNHGCYTWGRDVAEAKRHIEAYEFLFSCVYHRKVLNK